VKRRELYQLLCLWIVILGIGLRVLFLWTGAWFDYQHDLYSHLEFINYVSSHHILPSADAFWQAPQQPLYYWLASFFWKSTTQPEVGDLLPLASFSLMTSCLGLVLCFYASNIFSNGMLRLTLLGFLSLTPSLILASCRISNDSFSLFWGEAFFACACWSWKRPQNLLWLVLATICSLFAVLSKLNAVCLLSILPFLYWRSSHQEYRTILLAVGMIVLFGIWGCWSWSRAYLPEQKKWKFASYQIWQAQKIPKFTASYWLSFHFFDLLQEANAGTGLQTRDSVRFSFPTEQYGTLFTGEYKFTKTPLSRWLVRGIYLLGLLLPACFITGIWIGARSWLSPKLYTLAAFPFCTSLLLIILFVLQAPNVCSSDFRYHAPAFPWIGLLCGAGLAAWEHSKIRKILPPLLLLLFTLEGLLVSLIVMKAV